MLRYSMFMAILAVSISVSGSANHPEIKLTDITEEAGLIDPATGSHGAAFADVTGDGLPDLYLTYNLYHDGARQNRFYRNLDGIMFTEEAALRGIANPSFGTHGAAWADLDNDGDYDLLNGVTYDHSAEGAPNRIFRNSGNGFFSDATPQAMLDRSEGTRAVLTSDFNRDGLLDIFAVSGWQGSGDPSDERNELYLNLGSRNGSLNFVAIEASDLYTAPAGQGATDTDYDSDGWPDVVAANGGGEINLIHNDAGQNASLVSAILSGIWHSAYTGITSGDVNNDGSIDLVLADQIGGQAHIYLNQGNSLFAHSQSVRNFSGYTVGLADLDNDGDLDFAAAGLSQIMLNDGHGFFSDGPAVPNQVSKEEDPRTIAFADIDQDGDLDFVMTAKHDRPLLIRNDLVYGSNWLKVNLLSPHGQIGAFGTKVKVFDSQGKLLCVREARSNYGYLSQDDPSLHCGLGNAQSVTVEVKFLGGPIITAVVNSNQVVKIDQYGVCLTPPDPPADLQSSVTGSTVTLAWEPNTRAQSYLLRVGSAPGLSDLYQTSMQAPGLTAAAPPGTYFVRVYATGFCGMSGPSEEVIVRVN
ncbi:MAG: FG-GAP-like repeat-containing protein [bacterium]|nr:FG-GAP-like repeat-containing protein [bacterium]